MLDEPMAAPVAEVGGPASQAPEVEASARTPSQPKWRRDGRLGIQMVVAALAVPAIFGVVGAVTREPSGTFAPIVGILSASLFLIPVLTFTGLILGLQSVRGMLRSTEPVPTSFAVWVGLVPVLGGGMLTLLEAGIVALGLGGGFARGRQLRRHGKVLLPKVEPGDAWTHLELQPQVPAELREGLAAQWRENGRTEHASVAAFARLTLDLMALGAPPPLIHAANRDARDEIRHTELCFSLAKALDGRDASPGAFPEARRAQTLPEDRARALASLAVDSLIDGALREGVSARVIAQLARRCTDPVTREMLREIAADEGRHAAHGWDVVEWCLAEGGEQVAMGLRGAMALLPREIPATTPVAAQGGAWEAYGIHGHTLEEQEHREAVEQLSRRVEELTRPYQLRAA
jgi:hypothetical protein